MNFRAQSPTSGLLDELQISLTHGSLPRRVELLRRVTDLFVLGADDYSHEHIAVFDDVFACLVQHIHDEARAVLARRLAPMKSAPPNTMRNLALDDLIEVAAPVLTQAVGLDEATLIETVRNKSNGHLMAVAGRSHLTSAVADVLVERGDGEVVRAIVSHPSAALSDIGYEALAKRLDADDWIAACLAHRPGMPHHHYVRLLARASKQARASLAASYPNDAEVIAKLVNQISHRARQFEAALSPAVLIAHDLVRSLYDEGRLDDQQVTSFGNDDRFDAVSASLACLARAPTALIENILVESAEEGLLILGKVCDLSWPALRSIVSMRVRLGHPGLSDPEAAQETYERLRSTTAHQAFRFHNMQMAAQNRA